MAYLWHQLKQGSRTRSGLDIDANLRPMGEGRGKPLAGMGEVESPGRAGHFRLPVRPLNQADRLWRSRQIEA